MGKQPAADADDLDVAVDGDDLPGDVECGLDAGEIEHGIRALTPGQLTNLLDR